MRLEIEYPFVQIHNESLNEYHGQVGNVIDFIAEENGRKFKIRLTSGEEITLSRHDFVWHKHIPHPDRFPNVAYDREGGKVLFFKGDGTNPIPVQDTPTPHDLSMDVQTCPDGNGEFIFRMDEKITEFIAQQLENTLRDPEYMRAEALAYRNGDINIYEYFTKRLFNQLGIPAHLLENDETRTVTLNFIPGMLGEMFKSQLADESDEQKPSGA